MLRIKIGNFEIELGEEGVLVLMGILGIVGAVLISIFGK